MQSERAAGRNPIFTGMDDEMNRLRDAGDPFFQQHGVRYAKMHNENYSKNGIDVKRQFEAAIGIFYQSKC
jgi:hypothetical protein